MTLIILAHPASEESIANRTIIESLEQSDLELEIRDIGKLYPDHKINIHEEQQALLRHDTVIFQNPLYWFNVPAILKSWMDQVLTYQFAYGSQGNKLKDKKFLHSMTIGQSEENLKNIIDDLSSSVKKSTEYCQMTYVGLFPLYDTSAVAGNTSEEVKKNANLHGIRLYNAIKDIQR